MGQEGGTLRQVDDLPRVLGAVQPGRPDQRRDWPPWGSTGLCGGRPASGLMTLVPGDLGLVSLCNPMSLYTPISLVPFLWTTLAYPLPPQEVGATSQRGYE